MSLARFLPAAGVIAVLATGCVSPGTDQAMDGPMYPAGYADGCQSARERERDFSTEVVRDEHLFDNDTSYRTGWRQGYASCTPMGADVDPSAQGNEFDPF